MTNPTAAWPFPGNYTRYNHGEVAKATDTPEQIAQRKYEQYIEDRAYDLVRHNYSFVNGRNHDIKDIQASASTTEEQLAKEYGEGWRAAPVRYRFTEQEVVMEAFYRGCSRAYSDYFYDCSDSVRERLGDLLI